MVFIESPTNPRMKLIDIQLLVQSVREKNKDIILVIDNSFLSPYFQVE